MNTITLIMVIYRLCTFAMALAIIWMGYNLFRLGIYEKAGELKASWSGKNLTLRQAAPGTFFVVLGCCVLAVAMTRPLDVNSETKTTTQVAGNTTQDTGQKTSSTAQSVVDIIPSQGGKITVDQSQSASQAVRK